MPATSSSTTPPIPAIRFGVWANTHGTWGSHHHPEDRVDASWARNRDQILLAEELGYDATLLAQHTINPRGDHHGQLEAWTASAALAAITERIEIITAIKPLLYHPVVLAKQALQIEEISGGRFAINFVNAWFKPEIERAGITFIEHDERYAYGAEWLTVVKGLLGGEATSFQGRYFTIDDYRLTPASGHRARPLIYGGGESEQARAVISAKADVFFLNGRPLAEAQADIAELGGRPREDADPLRYAMAAFVIARETDEEAAAALQEAFGYAELDRPDRAELATKVDPNAVMFKKLAQTPAIGTNGGTAAGLVGSYDTVAERIAAFEAAGVELLMLQFQPLEAEMRRFAEQVIPRVRARAAVPA
jgi:alkanesulfonate monooxygenase